MLKNSILKIKELGIKGIILTHLGLLCCAIASVIFLSPAKLVSGGATGLAIFLNVLFNKVNYYVFLYVINFILLIISFPLLGKNFTLKSLYGSIMLPTFGVVVTWLCKLINFDLVNFVNSTDQFLVVLFSSFLMGFGIGINMKYGGSTGGFDILETILVKYFHFSFTTSVILIDTILIILGMWKYQPTFEYIELVKANGEIYNFEICTSLFKTPLSEGMCSLIYVILSGTVMDIITYGGYNKRAVYIRSNKYEEIHDAIINKLYRGMTYVDAEGGYSLLPTKLIICICYSREYFILRDIIASIDPNAFIFVTKAMEVRGLGFSIENPQRKPKKQNI